MRFSIWTAVSSKPQAKPDKFSLEVQEETCRSAGLAKGWRETGLYRVPGASRSFYVNLSDAEKNIPDLRRMLEDARQDTFDVLTVYTYDRLGDLADMIAQSLQFYGKQIYSVIQPVDPQLPADFDPLTQTEAIMRDVHKITQRFRITDLRLKFRSGMPKRVLEKGLPPFRPPYGYRKPAGREFDPDAVPVPDPVKAAVVIQIKDLFLLSGKSLWQIAHHFTELGIPTPSGGSRWTDVITRHIMTNRFYCGEVFFGGERRSLDPGTHIVKYIKNPPGRMVVGKGAHEPLWDSATQSRIDSEFKRRGHTYTGQRTHRLSNLLYCGVCGARVYARYNGYATEMNRRWVCKKHRQHVNILDTELIPRVTEKLVNDLRHIENIQFPAPEIPNRFLPSFSFSRF